MTPYYRSPDGAMIVYHATFEDVLAGGGVPMSEVALVHGDPPYGVNAETKHATKGRGFQAGSKTLGRSVNGRGRPKQRDFEPIPGDDRPFDPAPLLSLQRPTVLWGANYGNKEGE